MIQTTRVRGLGGERVGALAIAFVGAAAMVALMLLLRTLLGVATTFELVGDRLAPLIPAQTFSNLIHLAGGYNQLKTIGVLSVLASQAVIATIGGTLFILAARSWRRRSGHARPGRIVVGAVAGLAAAVWLVFVIALLPNLVTNYQGRPAVEATLLNGLAFLAELAVLGAVVGVGSLRDRRAGRPAEGSAVSPGPPASTARRSLLTAAAGLLLFGAAGGLLANLLRRSTFGYDGTTVEGPDVSPITPNEAFYVVTKNVVDPVVDESLWRLEVGGVVGRPATYTLADLLTFEQVEQETTLMYISNGVGGGLISNARWTGVRLADLLERAQPEATGTELIAAAVDGYTDTISLPDALAPTTLLAHRMNGVPLPSRHGAPVRLIVPGLVGEKQVKWLTRLTVTDVDAKGFYETQGWGPDFRIPARSRIDFPRADTVVRAGDTVAVSGTAFGGDRGVGAVEVSTDGGSTWRTAEITYPGTRLTWALWRLPWQPQNAGRHALVVRMIDADGRRQIEQRRAIVAQGALGLHAVQVDVRA